MNSWKVILATLVIFGCGVLTGALVVSGRHTEAAQSRERVGKPGIPPGVQRFEFLRKATKQLDLTAEQQARVDKILLDSQERTKQFFDRIAPQMREETRRVREEIRAQLTLEQQKTFEDLLKVRPPRRGDESGSEEKHHWPPGPRGEMPRSTNAPTSQSSTNSAANP